MTKVTLGDFQRAFGRWRTEAHKAAIILTSHGRDDLVVMSADEFKRLKALDQQAFYAHELPDHIVEGLGGQGIPAEAHQFEDEYKS